MIDRRNARFLKHTLAIATAVAIGGAAVSWAQNAKPIPGTGSLRPPSGSSFTFIVAGDNRPASAKESQPATPSAIMAAAKAANAAFVLWTGDTIVGLDSADSDKIHDQYKAFFAIAATAGAPVFSTPGNHEMDVKVKNNKDLKEIGSAKMETLWRHNMGLRKHAPIYGSFTYANAHFILLNTEEIPPAGTVRSPGALVGGTETGGKVNLDPGYVSSEQMKWLEADLASNKATHTFVLMHHPIKPLNPDMGLNQANADELVELFGKYSNISYVLASHEHLYYNPQKGDTSQPSSRSAPSSAPPFYLISGGAGAPLVSKDGFHNYLVFQVDGVNISAGMKRLP
jgi:Calcineurin-like phosphoesterase